MRSPPTAAVLAALLGALLCAGLCLALAGSARADEAWHESYVDPDEVARVYGRPDEALDLPAARALLLELTNKARRSAGLQALQPLASADELAQEHALEMARRHYINHYSLSGLKCEARYNALGQTDNVMENIAFYAINYDGIYITPQVIKRMQQHWLDSESHRRNILEPAHTHLGCSFFVVVDEGVSYLAGVAEFVADYGEARPLPAQALAGETLQLSGWLDPGRARLRYVGLGSEDLPAARSVEFQNKHAGGYSPPGLALAILPSFGTPGAPQNSPPEASFTTHETHYDPRGGEYSTEIRLSKDWPKAAYYVSVWADDPQRPELGVFCVSTQVVLVK